MQTNVFTTIGKIRGQQPRFTYKWSLQCYCMYVNNEHKTVCVCVCVENARLVISVKNILKSVSCNWQSKLPCFCGQQCIRKYHPTSQFHGNTVQPISRGSSTEPN